MRTGKLLNSVCYGCNGQAESHIVRQALKAGKDGQETRLDLPICSYGGSKDTVLLIVGSKQQRVTRMYCSRVPIIQTT